MVLRRSMKLKMIVVFIAFITFIVSVVGYFSYQQFSENLRSQTDARNLEIARNNGYWITKFINDSLQDVATLAVAEDFVDAARTWEGDVILMRLKGLYDGDTYHFLEVLAASNMTIMYRYPDRDAEGISMPLFFLRSVVDDRTPRVMFYSLPAAYTPNGSESVPMIYLSAPIIDDGIVIGVLNGALSLSFVDQTIENIEVGSGGYVFLVDHTGQLISHPDRDSWGNVEDVSQLGIVQRAIEGGEGTTAFHNGYSGEDEVGAYTYLSDLGWAVIVVVPEDEAMAPLHELERTLMLFMIIFIASGSAIVYGITRRVTVPLVDLTKNTERIVRDLTRSVGKPLKPYKHYRISVRSKDEIGDLARSLNHLTRELVKSHTELEYLVVERTSKLKQMNLKLTEANRKLMKADKLKSEFLANMSHELRTPLNSIIGFSEVLLNKSFGELTPQQEEFLHDIHNAGKHLLELINEILDLSKIEAGRMDLHIQTLDLETLVEEVQEVVRPLYTRKGLSFSVDIPDDLPKVRGDALRLKQVLYNLISNAIKFTPSYGLVRVIARPVRDMVRVDVIDTGIGIKKKNYETIFREFTQLDMSVSREHEGTGLGLPLAKKLVELHGGRIWFKSVVGAGSTFSFTIPQATPKDEGVLSSADTGIPVSRPEAAPASPKAPRPAPATGKADAVTAPSWERIRRPAARAETPGPERPPARAHKPEKISRPPVPDIGRSKVLIIDDSEETRDFLEGILREEGYDVIKAVDGESGVRKARQLSPFAILLDILLPDINGWDVLKYLKENEETADIPVIIVSVLDNAYKGISLGAVDFFVKPVDRDRLLARLKKLAITPREEGAPMRILVVDDQPQAVKLVATVLESEGYEVLKAYGGIQGLDLARSKRPDLIILDLVMPDMTGMEVLAELKKDPATREIPVMVLTAKHLSKRDIAEMKENVLSITKKEDFSRDRLLRELEMYSRLSTGKEVA